MTLASIAQRRKRASMLGLAALLASLGPIGAVERRVPGPLFGGGSALSNPGNPALDPSLPTGAPLRVEPALHAEATLCSPRYPLCVHSSRKRAGQLRAALQLLENAQRTVHGALQLPRAWIRWAPNFNVYLSDDPTVTTATPIVVSTSASSDRAAVSCMVPEQSPDLGMMVRCLAFAVMHGLDASETAALAQAYAAQLAWITGTADSRDLAAIDDLQANPELNPIARSSLSNNSTRGAAGALLLEQLQQTWQHPRPGWVATTLLALSRSDGASAGLAWNNEPDWFDVLRHSLGEATSHTADWLGSFALDRALLGINPDGSRLRTLGWLGDAGRVRFDWRLALSSLPRRVALSKPLQPLGTAYLWLDLDQPVADGMTLGFRAEWEAPVSFKWMLLSLDDRGREVGRLEVPFLETATSVERTWVNFATSGARAIIIAGVNLGAVDPAHPFDPDYEPWETHGCTVYLAKL